MTIPGNPGPDMQTPAWRREPYKVLFPLGMLLAWAGVLHWFLHGIGVLHDYRPVFHSIAQIQGFMMCFAAGFLFTAIPRRTGTWPPAAWQMVVAVVAPVGSTVAAWYESWAVSQAFWAALVVVLLGFAWRRFRSKEAARRPPPTFVWIPLSFLMGIVGSVLIAIYGRFAPDYFILHDLGRLLLLQGMFVGLVIGVGGMILPLLTRGEGPPDVAGSSRDGWVRAGHVMAALLLATTCWIEIGWSLRGGLALRALLLTLLLVLSARAYRLPSLPGWHRWLVWLSAWMIPAGYTLAALFPEEKKAGLHVVFIGGFALMAFSVGLHVTLTHGGDKKLVSGRPWQVPLYGGFLILSMVFRALVDFDARHFLSWIAASAGVFLIATVFWALLVFPRLWRNGSVS